MQRLRPNMASQCPLNVDAFWFWTVSRFQKFIPDADQNIGTRKIRNYQETHSRINQETH